MSTNAIIINGTPQRAEVWLDENGNPVDEDDVEDDLEWETEQSLVDLAEVGNWPVIELRLKTLNDDNKDELMTSIFSEFSKWGSQSLLYLLCSGDAPISTFQSVVSAVSKCGRSSKTLFSMQTTPVQFHFNGARLVSPSSSSSSSSPSSSPPSLSGSRPRFIASYPLPLHVASECASPQTIRFVFSQYPDAIALKDEDGNTPVDIAAVRVENAAWMFNEEQEEQEEDELSRKDKTAVEARDAVVKCREEYLDGINQRAVKCCMERLKREGKDKVVMRADINELSKPDFAFMVVEHMIACGWGAQAEYIVSLVGRNVGRDEDTFEKAQAQSCASKKGVHAAEKSKKAGNRTAAASVADTQSVASEVSDEVSDYRRLGSVRKVSE